VAAQAVETAQAVLEVGGAKLHLERDFDAALCGSGHGTECCVVISQRLLIYVPLGPVGMRIGYEHLGGLVRERIRAAREVAARLEIHASALRMSAISA
jgi:hypothetical protein